MFKLCCLLMGRSCSLESDRKRRRNTAAARTVQEAGENEIVSPLPPPLERSLGLETPVTHSLM